MKNNKGFTIIELIMSIAIVLTIIVFLTQIVVILKDMYTKAGVRTELIVKQDIISRAINEDFRTFKVSELDTSCSNPSAGIYCLEIVYDETVRKELRVDTNTKIFKYGDYSTQLINGSNFVSPRIEVKDYGGEDKFIKVSIPIEHKSLKDDFGIYAVYQYNVADLTFDNVIVDDWFEYEEEYVYSGRMQEFTTPKTGYYQIELWGAAGAGSSSNPAVNGKGGYTKGTIFLEENDILYLYIGQKGVNSAGTFTFNGGGAGGTQVASQGSGGGATDVRLQKASDTTTVWNEANSLKSRIMVAGGGGSASNLYAGEAGYGGGLIGAMAANSTSLNGAGGTQLAGGAKGTGGSHALHETAGSFGLGGNGNYYQGGGAGGGYFGGGGGIHLTPSSTGHGGGGSSFISGYAGVVAVGNQTDALPTCTSTACVTKHYSDKYFINGQMKTGVHNDVGKAKITYVSKSIPKKINDKLNNVRYIKSCMNGFTNQASNIWREIEAIKDGVNIAHGKTVTSTGTAANTTVALTNVTDGNIMGDFYHPSQLGLQCATVDLGDMYDLDEVAVWNFWQAPYVTTTQNTLSVGPDNVAGTDPLANVLHTYSDNAGYNETTQGKRYNAWNIDAINE